MNFIKKAQRKIVAKLDRMSTCPSCGHMTDVRGCTCKRSDCACTGR